MTGGTVVVLGETGRNFGAGMSGGTAYLYDAHGKTVPKINIGMVDIDPLDEKDKQLLKKLVEKHVETTGSAKGKELLTNWEKELKRFIKVMPRDYKAVLQRQKPESAKI
ncbi:MAG: hypothetical protein KDC79_03115, partial [Cyclobacteriaceae bacterium]|nr:hypothetical protein [Cyclobacteriaceae bacterium]